MIFFLNLNKEKSVTEKDKSHQNIMLNFLQNVIHLLRHGNISNEILGRSHSL